MIGLLMLRLGGSRLAEISHHALGTPGLTTLRRYSAAQSHLAPSAGMPTKQEVMTNVRSCLVPLKEALKLEAEKNSSPIIHAVSMFDELACESRIRWNDHDNMFLGLCREHSSRVDLQFRSQASLVDVFEKLEEEKVHYASEITVGAIGLLTPNTRIQAARPILISGTCKRETGREQMKVIETCIQGCDAIFADLHKDSCPQIRTVSIASDGEAKRGSALVQLTFKHDLSNDSPIFRLLAPCHFMNLKVGDDDVTADKDYCHVIKRLRNMMLRKRGLVVEEAVVNPSKAQQHLRHSGISDQNIRSTFNPEDLQNVENAYRFLRNIIALPPLTDNTDSRTESNLSYVDTRDALRILGHLFQFLLLPYICIDLSLSEQLEYLSAAAHLLLVLYAKTGKRLLPTVLYIDIMIMIKNVYFCVAKAKVDTPNAPCFIILLGTQRLEVIFGVLRTIVGNDSNLDVLQATHHLTGATEAANILAEQPKWDRGPRQSLLPAIDKDNVEITGGCDHINTPTWNGNVDVADVWPVTSWNRGRVRVEELDEGRWKARLEELEARGDVDILAPSGTLLVNVELDDDDYEDDNELMEELGQKNDMHTTEAEGETVEVQVEEVLAEQDPTPCTFSKYVEMNGVMVLKSRVLGQFQRDGRSALSTDRLRRIRADPRYPSSQSQSATELPSMFGEVKLILSEPMVTLIKCKKRLFLCVGEVTGIRFGRVELEEIELGRLHEDSVMLDFKLIMLVRSELPKERIDDTMMNQPQHDWRSNNSVPLLFTTKGRYVELINPHFTPGSRVGGRRTPSHYFFNSTELLGFGPRICARIQAGETKDLPNIKYAKSEFPYYDEQGKACFVVDTDQRFLSCDETSGECPLCSNQLPSQLINVIAHFAAHILYDKNAPTHWSTCGLCLSRTCRWFEKRSTSKKKTFRIDRDRTTCLSFQTGHFSYSSAAKMKPNSPCTNVPVVCKACPPGSHLVWTYFILDHYRDQHPHLANEAVEKYELTEFEKSEMKTRYVKETKPRKERNSKHKQKGRKLVLSDAIRVSNVLRSTDLRDRADEITRTAGTIQQELDESGEDNHSDTSSSSKTDHEGNSEEEAVEQEDGSEEDDDADRVDEMPFAELDTNYDIPEVSGQQASVSQKFTLHSDSLSNIRLERSLNSTFK
jgi:hypothetical protein